MLNVKDDSQTDRLARLQQTVKNGATLTPDEKKELKQLSKK